MPDDFGGEDKSDGGGGQLKKLATKTSLELRQEKEEVREAYLRKFRKEVDFHHKVAYRFEKSYKLGKKSPSKKA